MIVSQVFKLFVSDIVTVLAQLVRLDDSLSGQDSPLSGTYQRDENWPNFF